MGMVLNALVDSFLPQSEKCGTERVKQTTSPIRLWQTRCFSSNILRWLQRVHSPSWFAAQDTDLNENGDDDGQDKKPSNTGRYYHD